MKYVAQKSSLICAFFLGAAFACGAVPPLNVSVSDGVGKGVYKGKTDATGTFETPTLKPGDYVVQFTSTGASLKGKTYSVNIAAGKAKVNADRVAGEKFANPGVAMKITIGTSAAATVRKNPDLNNPAAIRALQQMEKESSAKLTGHVTESVRDR